MSFEKLLSTPLLSLRSFPECVSRNSGVSKDPKQCVDWPREQSQCHSPASSQSHCGDPVLTPQCFCRSHCGDPVLTPQCFCWSHCGDPVLTPQCFCWSHFCGDPVLTPQCFCRSHCGDPVLTPQRFCQNSNKSNTETQALWLLQALGKTKTDKWFSSPSHFSMFLTVYLLFMCCFVAW